MNNIWFDASYYDGTDTANIGIYFDCPEMGLVFKETSMIRKAGHSTKAELTALLKALHVIRDLNLRERTVIHGDSLSVIVDVKKRKKEQEPIYRECYALIDEMKIESKQFQWIERKYNKADSLTRKKPQRLFIYKESAYTLSETAYKRYASEVKGNTELTAWQAEMKINRNILKSKNKCVEIADGVCVFIYHNLLIYTKGKEIIYIHNLREQGKGYKFFRENEGVLHEYLLCATCKMRHFWEETISSEGIGH